MKLWAMTLRFSSGCFVSLFVALSISVFTGCKPKSGDALAANGGKTAEGLTPVRFLTDWMPQAEHGGFYQAVAKGFYRDVGLDVKIIPGGPGPRIEQKLIIGLGDIAMTRSDDAIAQIGRNLPFIILDAFMQRDPQAILLHEESPVSSFADLDGKSIMAIPGTAWFDYLKAKYHITLNLIPSNYGLAQFMADKNFIQQCFITNEPYFVRKNGGRPKTLLIADSGFSPYRVLMTKKSFARDHPEVVRAFIAASIKGWDDFINGDPTPAKTAIAAANKQMTEEFMNYSIKAMRDYHLVDGDTAAGERVGRLSEKRLQQQLDTLAKLKIISSALTIRDIASFDYLPPELQKLRD